MLKEEKQLGEEKEHVVSGYGDQARAGVRPMSAGQQHTAQARRNTELEKTVLSLRRLVERLQSDNKRLQARPCSFQEKVWQPQFFFFHPFNIFT